MTKTVNKSATNALTVSAATVQPCCANLLCNIAEAQIHCAVLSFPSRKSITKVVYPKRI